MNFLSMTNQYSWQDAYEAAILETDREHLMPRILEAQNAINARLREIQLNHGGTPQERQALLDAITGLQSLRKEIS